MRRNKKSARAAIRTAAANPPAMPPICAPVSFDDAGTAVSDTAAAVVDDDDDDEEEEDDVLVLDVELDAEVDVVEATVTFGVV